jgi:hypothetical protein
VAKTKVRGCGSSDEHLRNPDSYLIRTHESPAILLHWGSGGRANNPRKTGENAGALTSGHSMRALIWFSVYEI